MAFLNNYYPRIYQFLFFMWILTIPMKNSVYQISVALIILAFLSELVNQKNYQTFRTVIKPHKDILLGFSLIIASMTLSNILGIQATKIWHIEAMYILRYGVVFFILLYCYTKHHITQFQLATMIFFSLVIQGFDGLYQHFFNIDFLSDNRITDGIWLTGSVFYYNPFGLLMCIGAGLCIAFFLYYRQTLAKWQIILLLSFLSLFLYTLLFSLSRSSWVSFLVFAFSIAAFNIKHLNFKVLWIFMIMGGGILFLIFNDPDIFHRLLQLIHGNSSHRKEIWLATIDAFLQKPYFGYGLNSYKQIVISQSEYNGTHNSLLEILLFLGIFGFIAFSTLLFFITREIYRQRSALYFSFFLAFLVASQFDHSVISSKIFLSILTLFAFFIFAHRNTADAL